MTSQKFFRLKKPILAKKTKKKWSRDLRSNSYKKIEKKIQKEKNSKKISDQKKVTGTKSYKAKKILWPESSEARKVPG